MFSDFSANAILTKSLSKYGNRLKYQDYQNLLGCDKVTQIATYLKNNTVYKNILQDVNEYDIHRGYLEEIIFQRILLEMDSFSIYSKTISRYLFDYIVSFTTMGYLIKALMRLISNEENTAVTQCPAFVRKATHIDFYLLDKAKSFDDFLRAINTSSYYGVLKEFKAKDTESIDLLKLETALYTHFFEDNISRAKKLLNKQGAKEIISVLTDIVNAQNYSTLLRLKKSYKASSSRIKELLIPIGFFRMKKSDILVDAENLDELYKLMGQTAFGKKVEKKSCSYENLLYDISYSNSRKNIRFSSSPTVVAFSYFLLMQIELINIVRIVEGVRYNIGKDKIEKLLII